MEKKVRYNKTTKVKHVVEDIFGKVSKKRKGPLLRIDIVWHDIVDPKIVKHCVPSRFRKGVLTVDCSNSIWRAEMMFYAEELIRSLNSALGEDIVKEIIFR
ncbi:MAG: DUF721 domain-containing protein [Ignavibacteria bacterium]|nr:DUF721 domain-containing protein [Ignavibacteria bacterium]